MVWIAIASAVALSLALWLIVVPRIRVATLPGEDPAPDFTTLVTARNTAVLGVGVLIIAQCLHGIQPHLWPIWGAYVGAGATLVFVDALTTWLPLTLHFFTLGAVIAGAVWSLQMHGDLFFPMLLGGIAATVFFGIAWRLAAVFGFGDVRLAFIVGAVAGTSHPTFWMFCILAATMIGAIWALIHTLASSRKSKSVFAYGPSLWLGPIAASMFVVM